MKFDFVIGNPPYQEENIKNGRQSPVYNRFMDEAYKISNCVEMIHPARFLFNAGQTPKIWNQERLEDKHFKVLQYESDCTKIFPNTDIKGGVAITIRDTSKNYGAIKIFTQNEYLNLIIGKVTKGLGESLSNSITGAVPYAFTEDMKECYPETVDILEKSYDLRTNVLDKLYDIVFFEEAKEGFVEIWGQFNKKRNSFWIDRKFLKCPGNFSCYKVMISKASGTGKFGETLVEPLVIPPNVGHTQSYVTIGEYRTELEAVNTCKYLKTKFLRALLGVMKVTQDITPSKFSYVPLQDFTTSSDIDWSQSIANIDKQLYHKYGLSDKEINFIETNVKEME